MKNQISFKKRIKNFDVFHSWWKIIRFIFYTSFIFYIRITDFYFIKKQKTKKKRKKWINMNYTLNNLYQSSKHFKNIYYNCLDSSINGWSALQTYFFSPIQFVYLLCWVYIPFTPFELLGDSKLIIDMFVKSGLPACIH